MALLVTRRDPFADFDAIVRRAFPTTHPFATDKSVGFSPAARIVREGDDAVITLDLPGVDFEKDITVELDKNSLVISGERQEEETVEGRTTVLSEVRYGSFRRSFSLPKHVAAEALAASFRDGQLSVRVTGAYAGTEPQRIAVTGGATPTVTGQAAPTVDAE